MNARVARRFIRTVSGGALSVLVGLAAAFPPGTLMVSAISFGILIDSVCDAGTREHAIGPRPGTNSAASPDRQGRR